MVVEYDCAGKASLNSPEFGTFGSLVKYAPPGLPAAAAAAAACTFARMTLSRLAYSWRSSCIDGAVNGGVPIHWIVERCLPFDKRALVLKSVLPAFTPSMSRSFFVSNKQ